MPVFFTLQSELTFNFGTNCQLEQPPAPTSLQKNNESLNRIDIFYLKIRRVWSQIPQLLTYFFNAAKTNEFGEYLLLLHIIYVNSKKNKKNKVPF